MSNHTIENVEIGHCEAKILVHTENVPKVPGHDTIKFDDTIGPHIATDIGREGFETPAPGEPDLTTRFMYKKVDKAMGVVYVRGYYV